MTDYFALLGQPRLPWLESEAVRDAFLTRSASDHPDRHHHLSLETRLEIERRFAELNVAYQCLKAAKSRSLHLIELETGKTPPQVQEIPHGTAELFMAVAQLTGDVDRFLREGRPVTSPILKASRFEEGNLWMGKINALRERLNAWNGDLEAELTQLNPYWLDAPPPGDPRRIDVLPLDRLEAIYRLLSYQDRWQMQLQDRAFQLSL